MNLITVSIHSSEQFRTSAQQTDPVTAKSHQFSATSKALIQRRTYSEMIKCSSYRCVCWHRYTGDLSLGNSRCQHISDDSTVHVMLLRHHADSVHVVFSLTYWTLLMLIRWQSFGIPAFYKLYKKNIENLSKICNSTDS